MISARARLAAGRWHENCPICDRLRADAIAAASARRITLTPPKPGTHASHFGPWFDAIGNDPYAWQRAAVWSRAGRVAA